MPEHLPSVLAKAFTISTSEARRAIAQGAVRINGETLTDPEATLSTGARIQLGKRREAVYEPVRKEEGYVRHPEVRREETVSAWSLEDLVEKLRGRELLCGPLSRIVEGERQYYAYVAPDRRRTSLIRRLFRRKTP